MTRMHRFLSIALGVIAISAAVGLGYWWGHGRSDTSASAPPAGRKVLYWYDPMMPGQHFEKPGKSPYMDMQLLPKYADEATSNGIAIAPDVRQNLGIRTVEAKRGALESAIQVPGTIAWDLRQERIVSARVDTIVERLYVRAPFESVRAGQRLASVIAPNWNVAAAEARALGQAHSSAGRELQSAAHERLRALGLPVGSSVGRGSIALTSPVNGVVSEIGAREGQAMPAGMLMFRINGTRTVWLDAAIPQAENAGITVGTPVEATVDAQPGETFRGRIEALLPQVDAMSRARHARIVLDNSSGALAAGMFARVTLQPAASEEHVLVPTDALIGSGAQARVIVLGADNTFHPVRVEAGRSGNGMTEILAGLQGGERVVASGQFLIDSEANLSGALGRLNEDTKMPADVMPGMPEMAKPASSPSPERKSQP